MSMQGIQKVAAIFTQMQQLRTELLGMACKNSPMTEDDRQDVALAQMLEVGKDAMQPIFLDQTGGNDKPKGKVNRAKAQKLRR